MPLSAFTALITTTTLALAILMVQDIRHRSIPNRWWLWLIMALGPLRIWQAIESPTPWTLTLAWGLTLMAFSFILWSVGAWGGADAKGCMILAWAVPMLDVHGLAIHGLAWPLAGSLLLTLAWVHLTKKPLPFYAVLAPSLASVLWLIG